MFVFVVVVARHVKRAYFINVSDEHHCTLPGCHQTPLKPKAYVMQKDEFFATETPREARWLHAQKVNSVRNCLNRPV